MTLIEKICEELGVEVGEEWESNDGYKYRITQNGEIFHYDKRGFYSGSRGFDRWASIFNGDLKPVWKPKIDDIYYTIKLNVDSIVAAEQWGNTSYDNRLIERGLVFKTKEEAIEAANKMLNALKEVD